MSEGCTASRQRLRAADRRGIGASVASVLCGCIIVNHMRQQLNPTRWLGCLAGLLPPQALRLTSGVGMTAWQSARLVPNENDVVVALQVRGGLGEVGVGLGPAAKRGAQPQPPRARWWGTLYIWGQTCALPAAMLDLAMQ